MRPVFVFVFILILATAIAHAEPFDLVKFFNNLFFPTGKILEATVCNVDFLKRECTSCQQSAELWYNSCSGDEHKNYISDDSCSSCTYCSPGTGSCKAIEKKAECSEKWSCLDKFTMLVINKDCGISKLKCKEGEECKDNGNSVTCEIPCTPEWKCSAWSACANGKKQRTCVDTNTCADVNSYTERSDCECKDECVVGEKQCSENGYMTCGNYDSDSCTEWNFTACADDETCKDYRNNRVRCEAPCKDEWTCESWSECKNGKRQRICYDANLCTSNFTVEKERCGLVEDIASFFKKIFG